MHATGSGVLKKLRAYISLFKKCFEIIGDQKLYFLIFIIISILTALTEGLSVSLVVPILEGERNSSSFTNVPLIGWVTSFFSDMPSDEKLRWVAVVLAITLLCRSILQFGVTSLANILPLNIRRKMSVDAYNHILSTNISFTNSNTIGELMNGITQYPMRISHIFINLCVILTNSTIMFVYLVLMMSMSYDVAIVSLAFLGGVSYAFKLFISNSMREIGEEHKLITERYSQNIHETLNGMKLIRLSGAEDIMKERNNTFAAQEYRNSRNKSFFTALANPFMMTFAGFFICAVIIFFSYHNNDGEGSWITMVIMLVFLLSRLFGPVSQINEARATVVYHLDALEKFDEFTDKAILNKQQTGREAFRGFSERIVFEDVSFTYSGKELPTIRQVNFEVAKGEMVAIVGPSGAGKTTLIGLLANFYQPDSGQILIDGKPLTDLALSDVRQRIGIVSQDVFIFDTTIAENIAFGRENVTQAEIEQAAKLAAAHDFIMDLPQGYETRVGDRGLRMSGGQQQRIAIARLILRNPDILIFDEATSNLDLTTEKVIQDAMEILRADKTLIVIAHRLSTVKRADKIVVLNNGTVVEQGTHDLLTKQQGQYWKLLQHHNLDLQEQPDSEVKSV